MMDNAFHAFKVGFANEMGRYAASLEIDAAQLFEIFLADRQLNISDRYLTPGLSFGGPCLPKDVLALSASISGLGLSAPIIENLLASNRAHTVYLLRRIKGAVPPGARLLLAGLSFKPGTADLRGSVLLELASRMIEDGYALDIFAPELSKNDVATLPTAVRSRVITCLPAGPPPWAMLLTDRPLPAAMAVEPAVPVLRVDQL